MDVVGVLSLEQKLLSFFKEGAKMATKTFRSIYLDSELDSQLLRRAQQEDSSASRLVRNAIENLLEVSGMEINEARTNKCDGILAMEA